MGYRLHYAKTYKVEWKGGSFSYANEGLNELLKDLCPNMWDNNDVSTAYADELEISKDELRAAIDKLQAGKDYVRNKDGSTTDMRRVWMQEDDYSFSDIADFLQEALDNADADNDFVRFSWY